MLSHNDWIKKKNVIFYMLHSNHNKAGSELNASYLITIFEDASVQFFHREMRSQQMKWRQQYKHVLHISRRKSVYPKSYYKIPSGLLVNKEKEKHPDPTTELLPSQHLKSKINLKYMRDADFNERIIVSEKEDVEITRPWKNTCKFQPHAEGCQQTDKIRWALSYVFLRVVLFARKCHW